LYNLDLTFAIDPIKVSICINTPTFLGCPDYLDVLRVNCMGYQNYSALPA